MENKDESVVAGNDRVVDNGVTDLTFSTGSQQVFNTFPNVKEVMEKIQSVTVSYIQEIQKLGTESGLDIQVRPIFDMKQKGE